MVLLPKVRYAIQSSAQLILDVAKAASSHLDLPEVLEALIVALKPTIRFDGIGVIVIEGQYARLHSLHLEPVGRRPGESVESVLARAAASVQMTPNALKTPLKDHHISAVALSLEPYVCPDLQLEKRFPIDEKIRRFGIRSYVSIPLMKRGALLGAVDFASFEPHNFDQGEVQLLRDVSEIVSIAVSNALAFEEIVGSSQSLRKVLTSIDRVAPTDSTVLITGETGTGKELIAHAIHSRSLRSGRALVKVNCAALPAELIGSELFGHEKGAFTGALQQRIGRFEAANGGTIFLDEIGELTPEIQIALLRVLQEKEFERLGGNRTIKTDVRVIAATNKDLRHEVSAGRFRMDLFYRLNVFPIQVPALRERLDDIPLLIGHFAGRFSDRTGKNISHIETRSLSAMRQYSWPGNVRELQNLVERSVILADGDVLRIDPSMLMFEPTQPLDLAASAESGSDRKAQIEAVLRETRGKVYGPNGAAARLHIAATTLDSQILSLSINKYQF